jgi:hypothetical protein
MKRLVVLVLLTAGCGGASSVKHDGAPPRTDVKVIDAGSDGDSTTPGGCPTYLPATDGTCAKDGLACEYGGDPECLAKATCTQGKWQVVIPKCPTSDQSCPVSYDDAASLSCPTKDERCSYAGLACTCTNCTKYPLEQCSGPLLWHCEAPNADPDCPFARPSIGSTCPKESQYCEYGCEPDVSRSCSGGTWVAASSPYGCPISSRRVKRRIRYLSDEDRARIADEARALRLATYRYRAPAPDRRSHLGFILEDSPGCVAADMDRRQVDLYSYTSMVLVLAQQQQREIATLKRELAAMRAELARRRSR